MRILNNHTMEFEARRRAKLAEIETERKERLKALAFVKTCGCIVHEGPCDLYSIWMKANLNILWLQKAIDGRSNMHMAAEVFVEKRVEWLRELRQYMELYSIERVRDIPKSMWPDFPLLTYPAYAETGEAADPALRRLINFLKTGELTPEEAPVWAKQLRQIYGKSDQR
jgi:hypothetical protein